MGPENLGSVDFLFISNYEMTTLHLEMCAVTCLCDVLSSLSLNLSSLLPGLFLGVRIGVEEACGAENTKINKI